ncbi:hypothetical protein [Halopiger djelfimassiliensis]|uniref:hypothetical protein n=1 Tax=Halopiger djelfimassiliensis TaxID=1293047 RepID=UPI000677D893|nr:hypothetical protein [Halopiger djelfimassiliensis]
MNDGAKQRDPAAAFAERVQAEHGDSIRHLVAFGSAARGGDRGVHTDIPVLLVLETADDPDGAIRERKRQLERLAESVGLEYGVVFSVHVLPADRYEARTDHPFIRSAFEDGRTYV